MKGVFKQSVGESQIPAHTSSMWIALWNARNVRYKLVVLFAQSPCGLSPPIGAWLILEWLAASSGLVYRGRGHTTKWIVVQLKRIVHLIFLFLEALNIGLVEWNWYFCRGITAAK